MGIDTLYVNKCKKPRQNHDSYSYIHQKSSPLISFQQCSGQPSPCNACKRAGSECTFDEAADMRRKIAMKRTVSELEGYRELYFSILEMIRARDERFIERFVTAVRANVALDGLADIVSTSIHKMNLGAMHSMSPSSPLMIRAGTGLSTDQRLSRSRSQHSCMDLENLCDLPRRNELMSSRGNT